MFNQPASQSTRSFSSRTVRFGSYFLFALGCGVCGQSVVRNASLDNTVGSLNLNGGLFEFVRSGSPAESLQWSPTMVACVCFLVGIAGFLLQPLYLRSKSNSLPSRSKHKPLNRSVSRSSFHQSVVMPVIDRLIITPQSIVSSTCRSVNTIPEVEFVPRTMESFNQLLVQSNAAVIVLTRSEIILDAAEIVLGIQRLAHSDFDIIMPQRSSEKASISSSVKEQSTQDLDGSLPSSSLALHHFLCDTFGFHPANLNQAKSTSIAQPQNQIEAQTNPDCYIVRREALISMLNLSQWSWSDVITDISIDRPSSPSVPHRRELTRA